jgi:RNA polymerase sigma factor (sigma-70 family)
MEKKELSEKIGQAIRDLPPKQQMVFTLRFYEKMPYKEIAKLMKCKEGTAKALYHFALEKLSKRLGDYHPRQISRGKSHEKVNNRTEVP